MIVLWESFQDGNTYKPASLPFYFTVQVCDATEVLLKTNCRVKNQKHSEINPASLILNFERLLYNLLHHLYVSRNTIFYFRQINVLICRVASCAVAGSHFQRGKRH